jgi:hypothetical protein
MPEVFAFEAGQQVRLVKELPDFYGKKLVYIGEIAAAGEQAKRDAVSKAGGTQ